MTVNNTVRDNRWKSAQNQAKNDLIKNYNASDALLDAFMDYTGTYWDNQYDKDGNDLYGTWTDDSYNQNALVKNMIKMFEQYTKDGLLRDFNNLYTKTDWQKQYLPSDFASNYVNSYLNDEYNNALEQLERAYKRGTLNDSQYDNAISKMGQYRNAANSTYGQIDDNLMDTYAQDLQTKANEYATDLQNWNLSNFDNTNQELWNSGIQNVIADQRNDLTSDIDQMFLDIGGGNPIFDVNSIIGNAKTASGIYNTKSDNLMQAIGDEEQKNKEQKIGLGNQGMF